MSILTWYAHSDDSCPDSLTRYLDYRGVFQDTFDHLVMELEDGTEIDVSSPG